VKRSLIIKSLSLDQILKTKDTGVTLDFGTSRGIQTTLARYAVGGVCSYLVLVLYGDGDGSALLGLF
jgi:hypothetical protein